MNTSAKTCFFFSVGLLALICLVCLSGCLHTSPEKAQIEFTEQTAIAISQGFDSLSITILLGLCFHALLSK